MGYQHLIYQILQTALSPQSAFQLTIAMHGRGQGRMRAATSTSLAFIEQGGDGVLMNSFRIQNLATETPVKKICHVRKVKLLVMVLTVRDVTGLKFND